MTKQDVTNAVLNEMIPYLDGEKLERLKNALIRNLHGFQIVEENTEVSTVVDDNDSYLNRFRIEKKLGNLSDSTITQYYRETKSMLDEINKNFRDVTYDDIVFYFAKYMQSYEVRTGKEPSKSYLDTKRKHIKAFFNWCEENEYINKNPFARFKHIKFDQPRKEILSNEEIVMLRDACETEQELALIDLLLSTGIRVSECSRLNISNVDFQKNRIEIYGKKTRKWRTVYLDAPALKHLTEYVQTRDDKDDTLFINSRKPYGRLQSATIEHITKKIGDRAKVRKTCTVHLFRRTLATRLYRKGMKLKDIADLLGNSVATLEKYYIITNEQELEANYNMCVA